jgi:ankyrin repeat protein
MAKRRNRLGKEVKAFNKVSRGANGIPKDEGHAFLKAAKEGDLKAVTAYVEKYGMAGIDLRDRDWSPKNEAFWKTNQQTALFIASCARRQDVVEYLLAKGADPDAPDKYGYTPLMVSHEPVMAGLILDAGASIDQKNNEGGTALMWPTTAEMITFLIGRGANVEARDNEGKTALIRVAEIHYAGGHATAEGNLEALLKGGAEIDARDSKGRTALMNAAARAAFEEESLGVVEFLLRNGANPHLTDKDGNTAAMLALGPVAPPEPGKIDIARLAMEEPDEKLQKRLSALLNDTCLEQHAQIDRTFMNGSTEKIGVIRSLRLKK